MDKEKITLTDKELDAISGGYIVNRDGKYFVVDFDGNMIRIDGKYQK